MTTPDTPPPSTETVLRDLKGISDVLSALAESAEHSHTPPEALEFLAGSVAIIQERLQADFDARHVRDIARADEGEE
jgi:hypothetical protein